MRARAVKWNDPPASRPAAPSAAHTICRFARTDSAMKIAVGGMQHETNTFAPTRADLDAFVKGGGWPSIQYGDSLFDAVAGANLPVAGAIDTLRAANHQLVPLAWAAASPSAHVTREAFETIIGELVKRLQEAQEASPARPAGRPLPTAERDRIRRPAGSWAAA